MAYTPPAGNAVDFSWVGAAAYTPPAGDAVNFSFAPSSPSGTFAGAVAVTGAFAGFSKADLAGREHITADKMIVWNNDPPPGVIPR